MASLLISPLTNGVFLSMTGVCLFAYDETLTSALRLVLKALNNQTVAGLSHFQGCIPKSIFIYDFVEENINL